MKLSDLRRRFDLLIKAIETINCDKECIYGRAYKCIKNRGANINVVVIGGIHGDEPAGVCAALDLVMKDYPESQMLTIIPCANPEGYYRNTRENDQGEDINRQFDDDRRQQEEHVLRDIVSQADVLITLHEDDVHGGCYVYAPKIHSDVGRKALEAMSMSVDIVEVDDIFGDRCDDGLIVDLDLNNPKHGASVEGYGKKMGVPSFCLETPQGSSFDSRVKALSDGALAIIRTFQ
jgi:predicted deacylase